MSRRDNFFQPTENRTPLHQAIATGDTQAVVAVLESGTDSLETRNQYGDTPLHSAARLGHLAIVETLCQFGANVTALNADRATALDLNKTNLDELKKELVAVHNDAVSQNIDPTSLEDYVELAQCIRTCRQIAGYLIRTEATAQADHSRAHISRLPQ